MSIAGQRSTFGDYYQNAIAMHWVIQMLLDDSIKYVQPESRGLPDSDNPVLVDDVVIKYRDDEPVTYRFIQAKLYAPKKKVWTITNLSKMLKNAKNQLLNECKAKVMFVSQSPFGDFHQFLSNCQAHPHHKAFINCGEKKSISLLASLSESFNCYEQETFELAKRIEIGPHNTLEMWKELNLLRLKYAYSDPIKAHGILEEILQELIITIGGKFSVNRKTLYEKLRSKQCRPYFWVCSRPIGYIADVLRDSVIKEANQGWRESLRGAPPFRLDLEQERIPEKKQEDAPGRDFEQRQHSREWKAFDLDAYLKDPKGLYILSSSVGAGKTTFHAWLCKEAAQRDLLPLRFHCRELENLVKQPDFWAAVQTAFKEKVRPFVELDEHDLNRGLEHYLDHGRVILIADGLDQIESGNYASLVDDLLKRLPALATDSGGNYARPVDDLPKIPVLVTGRPSSTLHWEQDNWEQDSSVTYLRLRPMDDEAQRTYFGDYYAQAKEVGHFAPDLIREPMLAFMVRELAQRNELRNLRTRSQLYDRFIRHVFSEHEPNRERLCSKNDQTHKIKKSLKRLAFEALAQSKPHIQLIPADFAEDCLETSRLEISDLPNYGLVNYVLEGGAGDSKVLLFTHQSFQEYLAACWAKENEDCRQRLIKEQWNPKWRETILFLAGMEGEPFIRMIYPGPEADNIIHAPLFLAAACYGECADSLSFEHAKSIIEKLRSLLKGPFLGHALQAFARMGAADELIPFLTHRADLLRGAAALFLVQRKKCLINSHLNAICKLLEDGNCYVREAAVKAMSYVKDQLDSSHIESLEERLNDKDEIAKDFAQECIFNLNDTAKKAQIDRLQADWEEFFLLPQHLQQDFIGQFSMGNIKYIVNALEDSSPSMRIGSVRKLAMLHERLTAEHIEALARRLEDESNNVRRETVTALAKLHNLLEPVHIDALAKRLGDTDGDVRQAAAEALASLGDRLNPVHTEALVERLIDNNGDVRQAAVNALWRVGGRVTYMHIGDIAKLLEDGNNCVRWEAVYALANQGKHLKPEHIDALAKRLKDEDPLVRGITVHALDNISERLTSVHIATLESLLADVDSCVRRVAIKIVAKLGVMMEESRLPVLIAAISESTSLQALSWLCRHLHPRHITELFLTRISKMNEEERVGWIRLMEHVYAQECNTESLRQTLAISNDQIKLFAPLDTWPCELCSERWLRSSLEVALRSLGLPGLGIFYTLGFGHNIEL